MSPDVSLKSLEFASTKKSVNLGALSSVRVNLSNGESSQQFTAASVFLRDSLHTVDFEEDVASIRAVSAYDGEDFTARILFYEDDDTLWDQYNPSYTQPFQYESNTKYLLKDNQELIGVYGVQGEETFSSFGFIYKQKK